MPPADLDARLRELLISEEAVRVAMRADREMTLRWLLRVGKPEAEARAMVGEPERMGDISRVDYVEILERVASAILPAMRRLVEEREQPLHELVARWEKDADEAAGNYYAEQYNTSRRCADELLAVLTPPAPKEGE